MLSFGARISARVVGVLAAMVGLLGFWGFAFAGSALAAPPAFVQVTGSPFTTDSAPASVAFSPSGGLLATANALDDTVSVFAPSASGQAAALVTATAGLAPGSALSSKALAMHTAVNAGQTATACADITNFLGLVTSQTGKKLSASNAETLRTDAMNLSAAVPCH
jgi:hypothetical protein